MSNDDTNIAKDRKINSGDIMVSLFDQAEKYHKYVSGYLTNKAKRDRKAALNEILYGEIELEIRSDPSNFGLDDIKESAVKAVIRNDERYKKALNEYYDLVDKTAKFKAGMLTMEQRSYMLTNIVGNIQTGIRSVPNVIMNDDSTQKLANTLAETAHLEHLNQKKRKGDS